MAFRWRGPFKISGYGLYYSFMLRQLNGPPIKGTFHGTHLKRFIPRSSYLSYDLADYISPIVLKPSLPQQTPPVEDCQQQTILGPRPRPRPRKVPRTGTS